MSILDYNLTDVPDEQIVPAGEYSVKILSAKAKTSQAGNPMIEVAIGFPDEVDSRTCFHYITLPSEDDDEGKANGKLRRLREFYDAFGVSYDGPVDLDLVVGETAYAIIAEEEDEEYGPSNRVKRFLEQK